MVDDFDFGSGVGAVGVGGEERYSGAGEDGEAGDFVGGWEGEDVC